MHRIAITGSHGFIGSHLYSKLEQEGHELIRIPHDLLQEPDQLESFLLEKQPDFIYHLAAYGNMAHQQEPDEIIQANIISTWNLLVATQDIPYKGIINISTSSVLLPHETFYSATKASGERLCRAFGNYYNKPIINARPFSVYGPGEADFRFIPTVFRSCLEGEPMTLAPDASHDWIYIDDFVRVISNIKDHIDDYAGTTINLGTGISTTNIQVVMLIESITGKQANITERKQLRPFDTGAWISDTKIYEAINLREGLQLIYQSIK